MMAIEFELVAFVDNTQAHEAIRKKRKAAIKDAIKNTNPAATYDSKELKRLVSEAMASEEFEEIREEEGHPDLQANEVVRTRIANRCRLVGCPENVKKSGSANGGTKANRHAAAFCAGHGHIRRLIPRKGGYFVLRSDERTGIRLPATA